VQKFKHNNLFFYRNKLLIYKPLMDKIVILQNMIPHYRIPIYNELSKYFEIIVIHSGKEESDIKNNFKDIELDLIKIGPFNIQRKLINTIRKESPDIVIMMFDITWPISFLLLFKPKAKIIWWGLDVGKSKLSLKIKLLFAKMGYPIIFYHNSIREQFIKLGVKKDICFVANNTFHVENRIKAFNFDKKYFLSVGTLNSRKQLDVCIDAFVKINSSINNKMNFIIIGSGPEKFFLERKIINSGQSEFISLIDRITNPNDLEKYYKHAIASISYGQAGLSVLQSFSYGVPYITKKNTISGGEAGNIIHNINGIIVDDSTVSLERAIKKIICDHQYAKTLGKNAYNYYTENCTITNLVEGFKSAIESNNE
tara:strand:+ start:3243 stop:4346 length:1104 start_codon:yes stop_codon:yes gene_type:complete